MAFLAAIKGRHLLSELLEEKISGIPLLVEAEAAGVLLDEAVLDAFGKLSSSIHNISNRGYYGLNRGASKRESGTVCT